MSQQIVYDPDTGKYIGTTNSDKIEAVQEIINRFKKEVNQWKNENTYLRR